MRRIGPLKNVRPREKMSARNEANHLRADGIDKVTRLFRRSARNRLLDLGANPSWGGRLGQKALQLQHYRSRFRVL